jgi:hypothetical protein
MVKGLSLGIIQMQFFKERGSLKRRGGAGTAASMFNICGEPVFSKIEQSLK